MRLGLLITARCNAQCTHCATSCGPLRTEALSREKILALMDEAAGVADGAADFEFSISGGEPFLDFPLLRDIVAHGSGLGAAVSCQTNAYWAANDARARELLGALQQAGLGVLGVSVSRFHDEYIRRSRVERALRVARELGLATVVKCAMTQADDEKTIQDWAAGVADRQEIFPIQPYLREDAQGNAHGYQLEDGIPKGRCPAAVLTVREDGNAYTCCMPGAFNGFLRVGNVHEEPLEDLHRLFYTQGRQQLLRGKGPAYFARAAQKRGLGHLLRPAYADVCDLCAHLTTDPQLAAVAEDVSARHETRQLSGLLNKLLESGVD